MLKVVFPRGRVKGTQYIGAAHGTLGVLYTLVQALLVLPRLDDVRYLLTIVENTFEQMLRLQTDTGGFPTSLRTNGRPSNSVINHFCHGAPGAIACLLSGVELYSAPGFWFRPELAKKLLEAAELAGTLSWNEGLLLKGNSLCHGIAGNGLLIHSLARFYHRTYYARALNLTQQELERRKTLWEARALMFARALSMESIQAAVGSHDDVQRMEVGKPDHPLSLMEGLSGEVVMLADLARADALSTARFPAYDGFF